MEKNSKFISTEKLNSYREYFLQQRLELVSSSHDLEDDTGADELDIAQSLVINEMLKKLSHRDKDTFFQVSKALQRIEQGLFGTCEECEEPIAEKRLQALPHCSLCISCAEAAENLSKQYRS